MRIFSGIVFEDQINALTTQLSAYTSPDFDAMLGAAEKMAIFAVMDQVQGTTPKLNVWVETSPDRRNWIGKNSTSTADINAVAINPTGGVASLLGYDAGTNPGSGFCRLNIWMTVSSGTGSARVRVFVTGHAEGLYPSF